MLDQEKFFNTYKVREAFEDSGLSWDTLEKIYDDYKSRLPEMKKMADHLQEEISKEIDFHVHSIHNRCKDPEHLIEKIIRKVGVEKRQKYKNINEINTSDLRKMQSFVTQDTYLFNDTIANNIGIAKENATMEETFIKLIKEYESK